MTIKQVSQPFTTGSDFQRTDSGEPYIHLNWRQFVDKAAFEQETTDTYRNYATQKRASFQSAMGMNESTAERKMNEIVALYETWEEAKGIEQEIMDAARNAVGNIKRVNPVYLMTNAKKIASDAKKMTSVLKGVDKVLDSIENMNGLIIKYFAQKGVSPGILNGGSLGDFNFINMDSKTKTSLGNIESSFAEIKENMIGFQMPLDIEYKKLSTKGGKFSSNKTKEDVAKVIYATRQRLINTQGYLLEGAAWAVLQGSLDVFAKEVQRSGITVEAKLLGGESAFDGTTNKTDIGIVLTKASDIDYRVNIGFSAKAQIKESAKKITYGTYSKLLAVYQEAKVVGELEEYLLNNLIAKKDYRTATTINKLIAAKSAMTVVGGKRGDEVYFMMYLDKIVRVDEFFSNMATGKENQLRLDITGVSKISPMNKRLVGGRTKEQQMLSAYQRSRKVTNAIRNLGKVQVILEK